MSSKPNAENAAQHRNRVLNATTGAVLAGAALAFAYRDVFALVLESAPETPMRADTAPDLVLVLFLFMLFYRRSDLRRAVGHPGGYGHACALLAPSALILLWAHFQSAPDLLFPSLALAILGSSWLLGGAGLCRTLVPCVAILLFAMPIPAVLRNQTVYALQIASAWLTSAFLDVLNVTHARAGDVLELGASSFQVVEECSGIAAIGALSLAAVFYVGLFRCTPLQAALLIAVAPLIGLLVNSIRVLWLTLQGPGGARAEHSLQGLAVIAFGALALGAVDRLLGRLPAFKTRPHPPLGRRRRFEGLDRQRVFFLCALFSAVGAALVALPPRARAPGDASLRMSRIAAALGEEGTDVEVDLEFLATTGFDAILHKRLRVDGRAVNLFVGIDDRADRYRSGRSPKTLLPGPRWRVVDRQPLALDVAPANAEALEMENGMSRLLVYHWTVGFDSLASETLRSLLGLEPRRSAPRPGLVVRLSTVLHGGANARLEAADRLRSIVATLGTSLSVSPADADQAGRASAGAKQPAREKRRRTA